MVKAEKEIAFDADSPSADGTVSYNRVVDGRQPDLAHGAILYLDEITVSFDGFRAINKLSLSIDVGELRCIIGPNGAGKTTMMDVITGKTRADSGTAFFGQNMDLARLTETQIARAGIGRKFQRPTVFEDHSVFENFELALQMNKSVRSTLFAKLSGRQRDRIDECMTTVGQKQWLEIGMLLAQDPKLLLLDEPVAGMTDEETERTAELFVSLAGKHSLIVVEHDMDFVASIARKVTVLHEGAVIAEGSLQQVKENERVVEVYLGR
jgi:urea transport system ATP-binding protein